MSKFSVVIPNYNHGHYLPVTLEAVFRQSRPPDEVIVVDDASTDNSLLVLENIQKQNPTLHVLKNDRNLGVSATLARGFLASSGDYLAFAGADDRLLPGFIEKAIALLDQRPEAGIFWSECGWFEGEVIWCSRREPRFKPQVSAEEEKSRFLRGNPLTIPAATVVYRRAAFEQAGGFLADLDFLSDWFLGAVISLRHGFCYSSECLGAFRNTSNSVHGRGHRDRKRMLRISRNLLKLLTTEEYADVRSYLLTANGLWLLYPTILAALLGDRSRQSIAMATGLLPSLLKIQAKSSALFVRARCKRGTFLALRVLAPKPLRRLYRRYKPKVPGQGAWQYSPLSGSEHSGDKM